MFYLQMLRKNQYVLQAGAFLLLATSAAFVSWQTLHLPNNSTFAQETTGIEQAAEVLPPLAEDTKLFFVSEEEPVLLAARMQEGGAEFLEPAAELQRLVDFEPESSSEPVEEPKDTGHDALTVAGELFPSPDGQRIALQTYNGGSPLSLLLKVEDKDIPVLSRLTPEGYGYFLSWHPDSQHALYKVLNTDVADPGLWVVNSVDGSHQQIQIPDLTAPEGLAAAAFSPDGSKIVYATTKGMGFGSEIWLANAKGNDRRLIWKDEVTTVGDLSWSPNGQSIAFVNLVDSPVPFVEAGLWRVNADGSDPKFLTTIDGGRGQSPVWDQDSQRLFYVARENVDNREADYEADALVSSIRSVNVNTGEITTVVPADNSRQIDLSLLPDGDLLFASNRQGALELWTASADGQLQQLTSDGEAKRYPVFVPSVD